MMTQAISYRGKHIAITHDGCTGRIVIDEQEFSVKRIRFEHQLWACDRLYMMWPTLEHLARDLVDSLHVETASRFAPHPHPQPELDGLSGRSS